MPHVSRDGADIWYEEHGEEPPLMMAAGLGGVGAYWTPNLPAFARHYRAEDSR